MKKLTNLDVVKTRFGTLAQPELHANCDQIELYKMRWILASIYYHHEVRPDHYGSILEVLGYPTNDDLKKILGIK